MLLTLKQASQWASAHLNKNVTPANITYLIQYGWIEDVNIKSNHPILQSNDTRRFRHIAETCNNNLLLPKARKSL